MQFAVPFNWQMAQLGLQFFLLLAIPAGIVAHWLEKTFNVSVYPLTIPPNPKCFDNTGNLKANLYDYDKTSDTATAMAFASNDLSTNYNTISSKSIEEKEKDTVLNKVKNSKIT